MMNNATGKYFDICFIGAGLSCSYTLWHYIQLLEKSSPKTKVSICIIDKANEFWTGIPYGKRSGAHSLIITSIKEFLPEQEREIFIQWLAENFESISKDYINTNGAAALTWLKNNEQLILTKQWNKLYIPRQIFGKFLTERMTALMASAKQKGILEYELMVGEATDVQLRPNNSFAVFIKEPSGVNTTIASKKVILSIGSPPKKGLMIDEQPGNSFMYIQDVYDPYMHYNINKVFTFLSSPAAASKNILILGSNASSLEVIYNLQHTHLLKNLINKLFILSPNGMFPHRINEDEININYDPVHLNALRESKENTCVQILEAVKKDAQKAEAEKIEIAGIYHAMSHAIIGLLNELNDYEQKQFVYTYGVEIGKLQRRAGSEYLDVANDLLSANKLSFIQGRFVKQLNDNSRFQFEYVDIPANIKKIFPEAVDVIINCIGSEELNTSLSPLIQNLINKKICSVNGSNKGFEVDENFQSSKNFFVMGPLLSGTINSKLRIWHAESCPRIYFLGQQLAEHLMSS